MMAGAMLSEPRGWAGVVGVLALWCFAVAPWRADQLSGSILHRSSNTTPSPTFRNVTRSDEAIQPASLITDDVTYPTGTQGLLGRILGKAEWVMFFSGFHHRDDSLTLKY